MSTTTVAFVSFNVHRLTVCGVSRREIVDNHEKENALNIVTGDRTYQIYAESPEDARYISKSVFILGQCA